MRLIDADVLLAAYDAQHQGPPGKARELIENAPTVGGWISVKDRMPYMHQNVLVFVQHPSSLSYVCVAWRSAFLRSWEIDSQEYGEDQDGIVTHWMPMPEPPKEGGLG